MGEGSLGSHAPVLLRMFMRWATLDKSLYPSFLPAQKGANNAYLLGCEEQTYKGHLTPYFLELACGANVVSIDHAGENE